MSRDGYHVHGLGDLIEKWNFETKSTSVGISKDHKIFGNKVDKNVQDFYLKS